MRAIFSVLVVLALGDDDPCPHESIGLDTLNVATIVATSGRVYEMMLSKGKVQKFEYTFDDLSLINLPTNQRKLIFHLEPCNGVSYLLVRKTSRCFPNPFDCCGSGPTGAPPCAPNSTINCGWTHSHSIMDGSHDGTQTFIEFPATSSKYYVTIYAPLNQDESVVSYRFVILPKPNEYPRPGQLGQLTATVNFQSDLLLQWRTPDFSPSGLTTVAGYDIYQYLLEEDFVLPQNPLNVSFLFPTRILNTACGIRKNMDNVTSFVSCDARENICSTTIKHMKYNRMYAVNVIVNSSAGYSTAYAGVIVQNAGKQEKKVTDNDVVIMIASATGGTILALLFAYAWTTKLYLWNTSNRSGRSPN